MPSRAAAGTAVAPTSISPPAGSQPIVAGFGTTVEAGTTISRCDCFATQAVAPTRTRFHVPTCLPAQPGRDLPMRGKQVPARSQRDAGSAARRWCRLFQSVVSSPPPSEPDLRVSPHPALHEHIGWVRFMRAPVGCVRVTVALHDSRVVCAGRSDRRSARFSTGWGCVLLGSGSA
jgi:hypothetical protein